MVRASACGPNMIGGTESGADVQLNSGRLMSTSESSSRGKVCGYPYRDDFDADEAEDQFEQQEEVYAEEEDEDEEEGECGEPNQRDCDILAVSDIPKDYEESKGESSTPPAKLPLPPPPLLAPRPSTTVARAPEKDDAVQNRGSSHLRVQQTGSGGVSRRGPGKKPSGKLDTNDTIRRVSAVMFKHIAKSRERQVLREASARAARAARAGHGANLASNQHSRSSGTRATPPSTTRTDAWMAAFASRAMAATTTTMTSPTNMIAPLTAGGHRPFRDRLGSRESRGSFGDRSSVGVHANRLFYSSNIRHEFWEADYVKPRWSYRFHRAPGPTFLSFFTMEKVEYHCEAPTQADIVAFLKELYSHAELSGECAVVCLIYVERILERGRLELQAANWRPIVLCSLLLASKMWQDLCSWNVEFACAFPQFSLQSINRLEREVIDLLRWDLYIPGQLYAKYFFALMSSTRKDNFRSKFNFAISVRRKPVNVITAVPMNSVVEPRRISNDKSGARSLV